MLHDARGSFTRLSNSPHSKDKSMRKMVKEVKKEVKKWKMLRFGPFGMKIDLYYVELHGEFDGNGLRFVRAQKIEF